MDTPEYIYKYQALNINNLSALNSSNLWFSDFASLNDPFEATYEFSAKLVFGKSADNFGLEDTLKRTINNSAVCSFSKVSPIDKEKFETNSLMWSHYADQFSGICIEFDTKKLISSLRKSNDLTMFPGSVEYKDSIHALDSPEEVRNVNVMFKKHSAWKYEDEFRIVNVKSLNNPENSISAKGLHMYDPNSIQRIYIGGNMNMYHRSLLKVIQEKLNTDIELVSLSIRNNSYSFGIDYPDDDVEYI